MNAVGELYGNERLNGLLAGVAATAPAAVVQAVRDDVRRHVNGAEASDDLTLLVLRWNAPA